MLRIGNDAVIEALADLLTADPRCSAAFDFTAIHATLMGLEPTEPPPEP